LAKEPFAVDGDGDGDGDDVNMVQRETVES
jgi:hypothetical protein